MVVHSDLTLAVIACINLIEISTPFVVNEIASLYAKIAYHVRVVYFLYKKKERPKPQQDHVNKPSLRKQSLRI